jgi:hypothetical protein
MTPPPYAHDRPALAWVAGHLHQQRVVGYPDLIADGRLTQAAADRALRISNAIAADWAAIAAVAPAPVWIDNVEQGGAHKWERINTLAGMADRTRAASDGKPDDDELRAIADCVDALLWWETERPSARFLADLTIELRARAAADRASSSPANIGVAA